MADQPYSEVDVIAIAAIFSTLPPGQEAWKTAVEMDRGFARAVLDHLAAAGRLLPEGASLTGDHVSAAVNALAACADDEREPEDYRTWYHEALTAFKSMRPVDG